jgi:putative DNA primase/helicase
MSDALTDFVAEPQWVAWRNEDRDGKQTKVPYVTRDRRAEANDRTTWLTHDMAAALAEIIINGSGGGIGIELGMPQCLVGRHRSRHLS